MIKKSILPLAGLVGVFAFVAAQPASAQTASYSLSFPSEPVSLFSPTPPNHEQQIDAFLWRDGDTVSLKDMENLRAEWKIPQFVYVQRTSTDYFDNCPAVRTDLPCIRFKAHVTTQNPGRSFVSLEVFQDQQSLAWNSTGLEVMPEPSPVPQPTSIPGASPRPSQVPSPSPVVSPSPTPDQNLEEIQQKVLYLEEKVSEQNKQLEQQQSLLDRIIHFLQRFTRFGN